MSKNSLIFSLICMVMAVINLKILNLWLLSLSGCMVASDINYILVEFLSNKSLKYVGCCWQLLIRRILIYLRTCSLEG